jgi:hypothetical protein
MDGVREQDGEIGGKGIQKGEVKMEVELRGKDFHHPFTPYKIQEEFMETVYRVLEGGGGRVGILESPTGTVGLFFLFICETLICRYLKIGLGGVYNLHTNRPCFPVYRA